MGLTIHERSCDIYSLLDLLIVSKGGLKLFIMHNYINVVLYQNV